MKGEREHLGHWWVDCTGFIREQLLLMSIPSKEAEAKGKTKGPKPEVLTGDVQPTRVKNMGDHPFHSKPTRLLDAYGMWMIAMSETHGWVPTIEVLGLREGIER